MMNFNPRDLADLIGTMKKFADDVAKIDVLGMVDSLKRMDARSKTLLARFLVRAAKSGDASRFVKEQLGPLLDESPAPAGPAVDVNSRLR